MIMHVHFEAATAAEIRSAMAELLGTTAPIAVVTETVKPAKPPKGEKAETPKPSDAPKGEVVKDPFAAPPATQASSAPASTQESTSQPSASGPAATTTASPSEGELPTYDELKTLMTNVLAKKSASFAQKALLDATGFKALTGLPKEMYLKAKSALEAALV